MNEYQKQATDFLAKYGIELGVKYVDDSCPLSCDGEDHIHGSKHKITLSRALTKKKISFFFWNSFNDKNNGIQPSAYDILACAAIDINILDDFEDFCANFGYDVDSINANKIFKACKRQSIKLNNFFDTEEMVEQLQEIQ